MSFVVGLDLGQAIDFSALAVLERHAQTDGEKPIFAVRHLQRFQLGTAYTALALAVAKVVGMPPLRGSPIVVDHTGVGRGVVDLLQQSLSRIVPVTITAGQTSSVTGDGAFHVPKKELVTALQLLLQSRRLLVARTLPDAGVLVRELENFRVKITPAAKEIFGAWGTGQHDDLVVAVALAAWWFERPRGDGPIHVGGGMVAEMLEKLCA